MTKPNLIPGGDLTRALADIRRQDALINTAMKKHGDKDASKITAALFDDRQVLLQAMIEYETSSISDIRIKLDIADGYQIYDMETSPGCVHQIKGSILDPVSVKSKKAIAPSIDRFALEETLRCIEDAGKALFLLGQAENVLGENSSAVAGAIGGLSDTILDNQEKAQSILFPKIGGA